MQRSPHFDKVGTRYLFLEIKQQILQFQKEHPDAKLISLGIGDTTEPLGKHITEQIVAYAKELGTEKGYSGYGPEQGHPLLRKQLSTVIYNDQVMPDDIFISDGAKCDIGRLQILFGAGAKVALQDPAYPAYLDTSIIFRGQKEEMIYLPCLPENGFLPNFELAKGATVLFLCSPNNPTGAVFSRHDLEKIVNFAKKNQLFIVFDTAYSFYLKNGQLRSIYEIDGAKSVAIEIGSFSKMAGFSGVRLGWTVVPQELQYANGVSVRPDWHRLISTFFNGASSLAQAGGLAALSQEGQREIKQQVSFYLENTKILSSAFTSQGFNVYGGIESPYLWVHFPKKTSWQAFGILLEKAHLVTTPGSGFGPSGEGFLRISGFGKRSNIEEAAKRIKTIHQ